MPRDGAGTYTQPVSSVSPAVTNTTISSNDFNSLMSDISTEVTDSFDRSGKGAMLAALAMGGFKINNLGAPTVASDAARLDTVTGIALAGDVTGPTGTNAVANVAGGKVTGLAAGAFAAAGKVGEVVTNFGSLLVSTGTATNVTSIALTAGNWLLIGEENTVPAGGTIMTSFSAAISATSASMVAVSGASVTLLTPNMSAGQAIALPVGMAVTSVSGATTYFLTAQITFTTSTLSAQGRLTAVRLA